MVDQCTESADKCSCHVAKLIMIVGPSMFLYTTMSMFGWMLAPMWSGFVMSIDNLC